MTLSVGDFDVAPQVYTMVANLNTNVSLPNLSFPTAQVRAAFINYSVFRTTDAPATAYEAGVLTVVFNSTTSTWEIIRGPYAGDGQITFSITNGGQVQFSTTALSGSNHVGMISYTAKTLLQS